MSVFVRQLQECTKLLYGREVMLLIFQVQIYNILFKLTIRRIKLLTLQIKFFPHREHSIAPLQISIINAVERTNHSVL